MNPPDIYTHGHAASVTNAHATRTIANSAAYLAPHLSPTATILDVGCGPGSITGEFAKLATNGTVIGIDRTPEVIEQATDRFSATGAAFAVMDTYSLDFADDSFDIVHAHQVLQHLTDPVAALREMRRVARPGGIVAVRDADYGAMQWTPDNALVERWRQMYCDVARANGAEPYAGRWVHVWAAQAGFTDITPTVGTWLFANEESTQWWGHSWAERVEHSSLAEQALAQSFSDKAELADIAAAWRSWAQDPHAWFVVIHGELICRV